MCGVVAVFAYAAAGQVSAAELIAIRDRQALRGPDGCGLWLARDGAVGLAHRRLSVIDPSAAGAQPLACGEHLRIVFNGAIYNHAALREELSADGVAFSGKSDTEVLLRLYERDGVAMFRRLQGMFAFALWDGRQRRLLIARDAYGIKPLYYADDGLCVRVASQVQALRHCTEVDDTVDAAGLIGFLSFGSVPEPRTIYRGIHAVPAGHYAWVDDRGRQSFQPHCQIQQVLAAAEAQHPSTMDEMSCLTALREGVRESVARHLVADVPLALFLSSGVDSGALLGVASQLAGAGLDALTLTFESAGADMDESHGAAEAARRYGANHHHELVTRKALLQAAVGWLGAMDQPTLDGLNVYLISRAAKAHGMKVVLSGVGGDELFGGYPTFSRLPCLLAMMGARGSVGSFGRLFERWHQRFVGPLGLSHPKVAGLVRYGGSLAGGYLLQRGLFLPSELASFVDPDILREGGRVFSAINEAARYAPAGCTASFERICMLESCLYMRNQLLRDADWASMAHGVELRTPLVDVTLLSSLAPSLRRIHSFGGKRLLAQVPTPALTARARAPKRGFVVPTRSWLEHPDMGFDSWKRVPALARPDVPASRRLAYVLAHRWAGPEYFVPAT